MPQPITPSVLPVSSTPIKRDFSHFPACVERSAAGRAYAASRAEGWPAWRRAVYACGSPLIPLVRGRRVLRDIRRTGRSAELLPRILPALTLGLTLSALGELAGYALGPGGASRLIGEMELRRMPHVRRGDL